MMIKVSPDKVKIGLEFDENLRKLAAHVSVEN